MQYSTFKKDLLLGNERLVFDGLLVKDNCSVLEIARLNNRLKINKIHAALVRLISKGFVQKSDSNEYFIISTRTN